MIMNRLLPKLLIAIFFVALTNTTNAIAGEYIETITMSPNGNEILTMPDYWHSYFTSGHSLIGNPSWSSSNSNVVKVSSSNKYTCRIHAMESATVGEEANITCSFDYWEGVSIRSHSIYWKVRIVGGNPDNPSSNAGIVYTGTIPTDDWCNSGNYSISWYNKNNSEYTISTNKELAGMVYLINNGYTEFENKVIKLDGDIDLSGKKWTTCKTFKGTFDGQGHSIGGIYMGTDYDDQEKFGFFQQLENAKVVGLSLQGDANFICKKTKMKECVYVGGLTGYSKGSIIENCLVNIDIYYTGGSYNTYYQLDYMRTIQLELGGICGKANTISYCSFTGTIACNINVGAYGGQKIVIGGIAAMADTIQYCDVVSSSIKMYDTVHEANRYISGIAAANVLFCRSIIDNVQVESSTIGSYSNNSYAISGLSCSTTEIINSYSSVSKLELSSTLSTNLYYGGVCSDSKVNSSIANYSNRDITINTNSTLTRGYDGNTGFSSEQMQSSAFLEDLNMYSTLEMDGPIWTQDEGYPFIANNWDSAVEAVNIDNNKKPSVFSLSGLRLAKPQKGINIINGKKVIVR